MKKRTFYALFFSCLLVAMAIAAPKTVHPPPEASSAGPLPDIDVNANRFQQLQRIAPPNASAPDLPTA
jgi:hypothetical protein